MAGYQCALGVVGLPRWHAWAHRAVHLARLAAAHAADRVPDAAAIAGLGALTETRCAGSLHALTELGQLDTALTLRWPRQPKVREFHDALNAAHTASAANGHLT